MELFLQFGYGMKENTIKLSKKWGGATVILSPRDIEPDRLEDWSEQFEKNNVKKLFDPQCYFPKDSHKRLNKYQYHSLTSYTNLGTDNVKEIQMLKKIKYYNDISNTIEYILPGIMCDEIDDNWFNKNEILIKESISIMFDKKRLMTIALPKKALMFNNNIVEKLIEKTKKWDVDGYYIVSEHPEDKYLVEDAVWMSNILDLCAGLKLQNKKVILGYANHQFLCCSLAKIDAIASGSWLNVRLFKNKFTDEDDNIARKNTWYYSPYSLSEYKLTFLDIAYNKGIINALRPDKNLNDEYADILFNEVLPTSTSFNESDAFKHYLHCLRMQAKLLDKISYSETLNANEILLETAERSIEFNRSKGIYAQDRDFRGCIDINRTAIQLLNNDRGFILNKEWNNI
jgi:hypothetical protein